MQEVLIPELIWPCWAYALTRIGRRELLSIAWVNEVMPKHLRKIQPDTPEDNWKVEGTILVWENPKGEDRRNLWEPVCMLPDGKPVYQRVRYEYHAAVYEADGMISDMVLSNAERWLPFIVRQRYLCDLMSPPDFFLPPGFSACFHGWSVPNLSGIEMGRGKP